MTKIRRQKKRKVYNYDVNRKRLNCRSKKRPKITCEPVKSEWNGSLSVKANLSVMGLSFDPNDTVKITKKDEPTEPEPEVKTKVVEQLEAEAKIRGPKNFRLPNSQVHWLTKLLLKYGDDYKAMERDRKLNCFQETSKQLRAKIKRFEKIPEQYEEYLRKKQEAADQ
ncbi:nucleolar protein 16 [Cimex lectularius]|uniref:Nucleolar protein 16 n=1 Tax=Cimex lectularius TaxID=79782 RepID=A0A8I6R7Z5_CIMLE|nr:nucleolar protein 16 [Cimex lectularius]